MINRLSITIFFFLFVVYSIGEIGFSYVFYNEFSILRTILFGLAAALLTTYMLVKRGHIKTTADIFKYKKIVIPVSIKPPKTTLYIIKETLALNKFIVNTEKSIIDKIVCSGQRNLMDFGDVYTILFKNDEVIIRSKPKIGFNFTDTTGATKFRMLQIQQIVKNYCK